MLLEKEKNCRTNCNFTPRKVALALSIATIMSASQEVFSAESEVKDANLAVASKAKEASSELENITVFARRRAESIQDVPIAITALGAEKLKQNAINTVKDLKQLSPGLSIEEGYNAGNLRLFMRGVGTATPVIGAESGVGLYIDDVYVPSVVGGAMDLFALEAVEVLRGPQGTLYGRNSFGGAIKMYSKNFTDYAEGYATLTTGTKSRKDIKVEYSTPVVEDKLWMNMGFAHMQQDGFQELVHTGQEGWGKNTDVLKIRLQAKPIDDLTFTFTYNSTDDASPTKYPKIIPGTEGDISTAILTDAYGLPGIAAAPSLTYTDIDVIEADAVTTDTLNVDSYAWTAEWLISDAASIKYIGSDRSLSSDKAFDVDGRPIPFLNVGYNEIINNKSQEFQFHWNGDRLKGVAGLYYYDEDQVGVNFAANTFAGFGNVAWLQANFDPSMIVTDIQGRPTTIQLRNADEKAGQVNTLKSTGAFINASYDITQDLGLSVGLRYTRDEKTAFAGRFDNLLGGGDPDADIHVDMPSGTYPMGALIIDTMPPFEERLLEKTYTELTPEVTLNYHVDKDVMVYGTYREGFQGGQLFPRISFLDNLARLDPSQITPLDQAILDEADGSTDAQKVDAFELGLKSRLFDDRLLLNLSTYYYDYTNLLVSLQINIPNSSAANNIAVPANAGSASTFGMELESEYLVTDDFRLYGNLAYTDFKLKEVMSFNANGEKVNIVDSFYTDVAQLTPEWQGLLGAEYYVELDGGSSIRMYANAAYRDDIGINSLVLGETFGLALIPDNPDTNQYFVSKAMTDVTLGFTLKSSNEHWEVTAAVKNATNQRRPVATRFASIGFLGVAQSWNTPRTWELSVNYIF
jgi:iron complex outermembrane recepter protein